MIAVIAWKEWREQRFFGTLLTLVGVALIITLVTLTDQSDLIRRMGSILIVITIGIVSGAMLLASETENQTQWFLDRTPATRFNIARAKMLFGLLFTFAQALVIAGVGVAVDCFPPSVGLLLLVVVVPSFIVGVCGSALTQSVLAAAGVAVILLIACFSLAYVMTFSVVHDDSALASWLMLSMAFLSLPLSYSMWVHTRPDRLHRQGSEELEPAQTPLRLGIGSLLWLSYRQTRVMVVIMAVQATLMGMVMMRPMPIGPFMWVTLTAILGMIVGVTMFADEHRYGAERFWGERRLPVKRLWTIKMIVHLGLLTGLFVLFALPSVASVQSQFLERSPQSSQLTGIAMMMHSTMVDILQGDAIVFVFVGPLYGFAVGQLAGVLLRKPLVAAVVTLLSVGPWLALWMPSFIAGGVSTWQWLLPPVALLITSRLLMDRWASDRLKSGRGILIGASGVTAAIGLTALGLGYRVVEVPNVPDAFVASGYEAKLMPFEANEAGRLLRQSAEVFERVAVNDGRSAQMWLAELLAPDVELSAQLAEQINAWQSPDWEEPLHESQKQPLGMVEDPRLLTIFTPMRYPAMLNRMADYLAIQGLMQQLQGKPEAFLDRLDAAIWIMRNLRSHAPAVNLFVVRQIETLWAEAIRVWASRLQGHPEWLERAQKAWSVYVMTPIDLVEMEGTAQMIMRNTLQTPRLWLRDFEGIYSEPLVSWVTFAWNVPWERERHERELRILSNAQVPNREIVSPWLRLIYVRPFPLPIIDTSVIASNHATILDLALRRYALEHGEFPEELTALVPKYLAAIPNDPMDGPFRYRRSKGEEYIEMEKRIIDIPPMIMMGGGGEAGPGMAMGGPIPFVEPAPMMDHPPAPDRVIVELKKGDALLWSIANDNQDNGGERLKLSDQSSEFGDWIWIVRPPKVNAP